ncbi:MAG TPA: glycoside hydrolase family 15 protein [Vicinamibacterales bacterium]|nr:glycoside hydrolase family 15 protein [Vicinamibacterales bacterium]
MMHLEDYGLIGNCQVSALVGRDGSIDWCCIPRFDAEPVFGRLLDPDGGRFAIQPGNGGLGVQAYVDNTNVLTTTFCDLDGRFRVIDFAPRFMQGDRVRRPTLLVRIVEPLEGCPAIRVSFDPRLGWSKERATLVSIVGGSLRAVGYTAPLTLFSSRALPSSSGEGFALTEALYFVLSWDVPLEDALPALCREALDRTVSYWRRWVKHCNVPTEFQREVIRSALALKLHCYEDTGAIVAAMTTSIPEAPRSRRTWDYRYCWLRDAYYVLDALRLLGHFEEREAFIRFLLDICERDADLDLKPLYGIDGRTNLEEHILPDWRGYHGDGPVRVGNGAATHQQHDVFGEMVLALAPVYMDERFADERSSATLDLLARLARKAIKVVGTPDAGIWEYRKDWEPQTFSSLMCWAAADRMSIIAMRHRPSIAGEFAKSAATIHREILARAWRPDLDAIAATYAGSGMDAALLQMAPLRFLQRTDPRLASTVDRIGSALGQDGWIYRYRSDDGLGVPEVAFVICTFWYIEALAMTGRREQARRALQRVCDAMTPLGLLAEDYDTPGLKMRGNFPQAYSHVGLIHAAFAVSPRWDDVA